MKLKATLGNGNIFEKDIKHLIMTRDFVTVDGAILYSRHDGVQSLELGD